MDTKQGADHLTSVGCSEGSLAMRKPRPSASPSTQATFLRS